MSGYRQSGFDPNAYAQAGRPMRPYNWVQWLGAACMVVGLAIDFVYFAGRLGWIRPIIDSPAPALVLIFPGIALINSRRYPPTDPVDLQQRDRNRRMLAITVFILTLLLGAAVFIQFSGVR